MRFNAMQALNTPSPLDPKEVSFSEWWNSKLEPQRNAIIKEAEGISAWLWDIVFNCQQRPIAALDRAEQYAEEIDKAIKDGDLSHLDYVLNPYREGLIQI